MTKPENAHMEGESYAFSSLCMAGLLRGDGAVLRVTQRQPSLWDAVIPSHLLELNEELAKVDELLDDADVLAPFIERFSCRIGRPTVPVDTFLRLM